MGGLAGHMKHVIDNEQFTYQDINNIINGIISGEIECTEKVDGFNITVVVRNGEIKFARNKTDIKNGGVTGNELLSRYTGNYKVYSIFKTGIDICLTNPERFHTDGIYNCEIVKRGITNIMYYPYSMIVIHSINGKEDGTRFPCEEGEVLTFQKNPAIDILLAELSNLLGKQTIGEYLKARFLSLFSISNEYVYNFVMYNKPAAKAIRESGFDLDTLKENRIEMRNLVIEELDRIITNIAVVLIDNGRNFINSNYYFLSKNTPVIKVLKDAFIDAAMDFDQSPRTRYNLKKFASTGNYFPVTEGIVFNYCGGQYKLTGSFAPLNQLLGGR